MGQTGLGLLLVRLREERGLSLRELAQLAGVDHAYIYRLESGDKESPSEDVLSKLARALKAPKREADMLRYLADHSSTDPGLVNYVFEQKTVSYEVFASAAGAAFRGSRPEYAKLVERVRRILSEDEHGSSG